MPRSRLAGVLITLLCGGGGAATIAVRALAAPVPGDASAAVHSVATAPEPPVAREARGHGRVTVQVLGANDLHGNLEPRPSASGTGDGHLGGAAALAAALDRAQSEHPTTTIRVHGGDMIGASPMLSAWFHDEPTMRVLNRMNFDVGTLGNHEFDEGGEELERILHGGHREDGRQLRRAPDGGLVDTSAPDYEGAAFPYVAANTVDREGGLGLRPYRIVRRGGVRIGVIGVVTRTAPRYLLRKRAERFRFLDISDSVNRYARVLRRRGVNAIVVLAHSGATPRNGDPADAKGEIIHEAAQMSSSVDVVIAGHSHSALDARVPRRGGRGGMLVVESRCYAFAYDKVLLTIDRATGEVIRKRAAVVPVLREEVGEDPGVRALIDGYKARLRSISGRVVAQAGRPLVENGDGRRELLDVAAEGQRRLAAADVAIADRHSLRDGLAPGTVTYADAFGVQAYDHDVWRLSVGGRRLARVLRQVADDSELRIAGPLLKLDPGRRYTVAVSALLLDAPELRGLRRAAGTRIRVGSETEAFADELARRGQVG